VTSIALSRDGMFAVSGGMADSVSVWCVATGDQVHCVNGLHGQWVSSVALILATPTTHRVKGRVGGEDEKGGAVDARPTHDATTADGTTEIVHSASGTRPVRMVSEAAVRSKVSWRRASAKVKLSVNQKNNILPGSFT